MQPSAVVAMLSKSEQEWKIMLSLSLATSRVIKTHEKGACDDNWMETVRTRKALI